MKYASYIVAKILLTVLVLTAPLFLGCREHPPQGKAPSLVAAKADPAAPEKATKETPKRPPTTPATKPAKSKVGVPKSPAKDVAPHKGSMGGHPIRSQEDPTE